MRMEFEGKIRAMDEMENGMLIMFERKPVVSNFIRDGFQVDKGYFQIEVNKEWLESGKVDLVCMGWYLVKAKGDFMNMQPPPKQGPKPKVANWQKCIYGIAVDIVPIKNVGSDDRAAIAEACGTDATRNAEQLAGAEEDIKSDLREKA